MKQKEYVQVWDLLVRIIHWALPVLGIVVLFSGDEDNSVHFYAGGMIMALVLLRIFWGFVGSKYARFSDFIRSPLEVITYLSGLLKGSHKRYLGHNPAAGWMMLILLIMTLTTCATGIMAYLEENETALAFESSSITNTEDSYTDVVFDHDEYEDDEDEEESEFWEHAHKGSVYLLLMVTSVHIVAAVVSVKLYKGNLILSMITGKKERG